MNFTDTDYRCFFGRDDITASEFGSICALTPSTASRRLKALVDNGRIRS